MLHCTAKELAGTLNVPLADVQAWEAGERFPTKQWVNRMAQLAERGPGAVVRAAKRTGPQQSSPLAQLDNPEIWMILRKLLSHPKLLAEVSKVAASYKDPLDSTE